jgi:hypothetical protein
MLGTVLVLVWVVGPGQVRRGGATSSWPGRGGRLPLRGPHPLRGPLLLRGHRQQHHQGLLQHKQHAAGGEAGGVFYSPLPRQALQSIAVSYIFNTIFERVFGMSTMDFAISIYRAYIQFVTRLYGR